MKTRRKVAIGDGRGFTLVEVLVASMILVVALLSLATMFPVGYRQITDAGRMTMAVTGGRHILEDIGALPFDSVINLNGVDTGTNAGTISGLAEPERTIARRWRYMLAGAGDGFSFSGGELAEWGSVTSFGGRATIQVACVPGPCPAGNLRTATVTLTVPGLPSAVTMSTVLVRFF